MPLPFPLNTQNWHELSDSETFFFAEPECLISSHAAQIHLLNKLDARRFSHWALNALPVGWPDHSGFLIEHRLNIQNKWNKEKDIQEVRQWLHDLQIPFAQTIYLIYDFDQVVQTTWKLLVRYWDQFAWSIGYAMTCVDETQQWACTFHHEDMILFGSHRKP